MRRDSAYITGIGQSEVGVRVTRSPMLLTVDAVKEALQDAGLTLGQIDGVSSYPGRKSARSSAPWWPPRRRCAPGCAAM